MTGSPESYNPLPFESYTTGLAETQEVPAPTNLIAGSFANLADGFGTGVAIVVSAL